MAKSEWTTITPEYLVEYDAKVVKTINDMFDKRERELLSDKISSLIEQTVFADLRANLQSWMGRAMADNHIGQVEVGQRIGVSHTTVGRWLSAKTDVPLKHLLRFYLLLGGTDESDHPFLPVATLNLGAYRAVLNYVRLVLAEGETAGRAGVDEISLPKIFKKIDKLRFADSDLNQNKILWMNYLYSKIEIANMFDQSVYDKFKKWILLRGVYENYHLLDPAFQSWGNFQDLHDDIQSWAMPWLICLRLLAERRQGMSEYCVSSQLPIRIQCRTNS